MDQRALRWSWVAGLLVLAGLLGWWLVTQVGITALMIVLLAAIPLTLAVAYLREPGGGSWATRLAGLIGAAIFWGLAWFALGIRGLCFGNPDAAERSACDIRWLVIVGLLGGAGAVILIVGWVRARRAR